ncbi:hypothetical protein NDU88_005542 [Pleurodeles waltl]|uniref:Uncharacterized protein n=1 Tax=Pleurodeles waltl TaxID=8319 RepID=A0AAV7QJ53_PLEWA|nr:hypothetical protein NDU88_005542 [Pleurodeles waltl]
MVEFVLPLFMCEFAPISIFMDSPSKEVMQGERKFQKLAYFSDRIVSCFFRETEMLKGKWRGCGSQKDTGTDVQHRKSDLLTLESSGAGK